METNIKTMLLKELTHRQTRNSAYSLRAFARDLNVGATTLSDVLADKRNFSKTNLKKVMEKMMLSPVEKDILEKQNTDKSVRTSAEIERTHLSDDTFHLIADWYYLAILNLAKIPHNKGANPAWTAKRLGIKMDQAEEALKRLLRLELIKKTRHQIFRTSKPLTTSNDIPSEAIRKHHNQNLLLAEKSLHNDPIAVRDFGSVTMSVNLENLPRAKEILFKTRKKIAALLEEGPVSEVYTLSFQLFPLTQSSGLGEKNG
jgi:uncharacterized protein (TIGR02147 family)